jgi:hypothetical protein
MDLRPYNFPAPKQMDEGNTKNYRVSCPPYDVLLDHTLGVIWNCFANKGKNMGRLRSPQVIWALKFVEGVVDKRPDSEMNLLIDYLTEVAMRLIEQEGPQLEVPKANNEDEGEDNDVRNLSISLADMVKDKKYTPPDDDHEDQAEENEYRKFAALPSGHSSVTSLKSLSTSELELLLRDLTYMKGTIEDWRKHQDGKIDLERKHMESLDNAIKYLERRQLHHGDREG